MKKDGTLRIKPETSTIYCTAFFTEASYKGVSQRAIIGVFITRGLGVSYVLIICLICS